MHYELYYWPSIQGRGEFVRLALEDANVNYTDVARGSAKSGEGIPALMELLEGDDVHPLPFAPPILKAGKRIISQTANILLYLGARHGLAPKAETGRLWTHQLQLTMADLTVDAHNAHHPLASGLYYADQKKEARRATAEFLKVRAPKYLDYFEHVLARNPSGEPYLVGGRRSYADLSLFQVVSGLRYAFPNAMARLERRVNHVVALHDRIAARPRIKAYVASDRRIPFNEDGIFRHYPELDA